MAGALRSQTFGVTEGKGKKKRNTHWIGSSSYEPGNENRLLLMRVRGVMKTARDMKCFIPTFIHWILASQADTHMRNSTTEIFKP